jgi:hypothetical protein
LDFTDVIDLLEGARRGFVEVFIELSPADEERGALVGTFSGLLEAIAPRTTREGDFWLYVRLSPEHASARGSLILSRTRFQRAEEDSDDDPMTLTVWQRGVKLRLRLYGPPADEPDNAGPAGPTHDDIPF